MNLAGLAAIAKKLTALVLLTVITEVSALLLLLQLEVRSVNAMSDGEDQLVNSDALMGISQVMVAVIAFLATMELRVINCAQDIAGFAP